ncbi:MAG: LamG-like jellyroll fold domain-containing protein, partial [Luteolibacter sp.]
TNGATPNKSANHVGVYTPGNWQHVAITYQSDDTTTTVTTYIDGIAASSFSEQSSGLSDSAIHIGNARTGSLSRAFDGKIDEFAAWSRPLSANEIAEIALRGPAGYPLTTNLADQNAIVVTVTASGLSRGSVSGSGIFSADDTTPISATANPGYTFSEWTGDFAGQPQSFVHTVSGNANSTAVFIEDSTDSDNDGLSNYLEIIVHNTLPDNPDSDGDQIPDGVEINQTGTDPNYSDDLAVDYVMEYLCDGGSPNVGANEALLSRNPADDTVIVQLGTQQSTQAANWSELLPADTSSSELSGNDLQLVIPGSADVSKFFRFAGGAAPSLPE